MIPQSAAISAAFEARPRALLQPALEPLLIRVGPMGHALRCVAWAIGAIMPRKVRGVQPLPDGRFYVECCARYVERIANDGACYATILAAWDRVRDAVGWEEVEGEEAARAGAVLRPIPPNRRRGRHLILDRAALDRAVELARAAGEGWETPAPPAAEDLEWQETTIQRWPVPCSPGQQGSGRTSKASCPNKAGHKHEDRDPSLVLWSNPGGLDGGCRCMGCGRNGRWQRSGRDPDRILVRLTSDEEPGPGASEEPWPIAKEDPLLSRGLEQVELMGPRGGWTSDPGIPAGEHAARWQSLGLSMTRIRAGGPRHRLEEDVDRATVTTALQAVTWKGDPEGRVFLRRTRGNPVLRDPLSVLEWSEARAKGPKAGEQALLARAFVRDGLLDHRLAIDTPLVSVSYMEAEGYREIRTRDGREVRVPEKWAPFAQRYVLLDLDDIDLDGADEAELARAVRGVLRRDPELSGVCAVVRTGPRGVQAWAELREVRIEPRSWFARPEVRSWYRSLGERVLRAIRRAGGRGGVLDPSSCAAGRFGRRPGWRVLPDYGLFRSRLLLVERERAENRAPRVSYNRAEGKP